MIKKYKVLFGVMLGLFILIFGVSCCVIGIADCNVEKNYFAGGANPYIAADTAMVSAHRAGSILAPENTMNAFKLGIEEATTGGYTVDIWEFDLHITKDGELILLHDHTLDRTSDSEQVFGVSDARPEDYTLAELRRLNMGYDFERDGEYPFRDLSADEVTALGLRVCTLEEVLDYMTDDIGSDITSLMSSKLFNVLKQAGVEINPLDFAQGENLETAKSFYSVLSQIRFGIDNLRSAEYSRITFTLDTGVEDEKAFALLDRLYAGLGEYYEEFYLTGESVACYDMAEYFTTDNMVVCLCSLGFILVILLFTFRNFSLPVILALAIQGGIWINFAIPFLAGNSVTFIGYLIITAIQMGATIDYAIVLTNRYRTTRHLYPDRYTAMAESENAVFSTIITSGSILTITGFALGIAASGVVAQLGILLGIGTLASILIVLFILPSMLLVTEKLTDKTNFPKLRKRKAAENAGENTDASAENIGETDENGQCAVQGDRPLDIADSEGDNLKDFPPKE